ncbi:MAG TPA: hypothetical protein VNG95_03685 [Gemmatimonadales bacterium]|nr:hypothetical protein [Gemmatimonadales bacterium]
MRRTATRTLAISLLSLLPSFITAQRPGLREVSPWESGPSGGFGMVFGVPRGAFNRYVASVGGVDGFVTVPLGRSAPLAFRFEGSVLFHGGGSFYDKSSGLSLSTQSYITSLRVGPQLMLGAGPVRVYGLATAGFSWFATRVSFDGGGCGCSGYGDGRPLLDDVTGTWESGGGVQIAVGRRGQVLLDLGARYQHNAPVSYLNDASVTSDGNGGFVVQPIHSAVNLVTYHLGITLAMR